MNTLKRFTAMCLCLFLFAGVIGCGKGGSGSGDGSGGQTAAEGSVYTAEFKTLENSEAFSFAAVREEKLYYCSWLDDENGDISAVCRVMDLNTLETETIPMALSEKENINQLAVTPEGNLLMLIGIWDEDRESYEYELRTVDFSGTEINRQDITGLLAGEDTGFGVYIQDMAVDAEGNICLLTGMMNLVLLDSQFQKLAALELSSWPSGLCQSRDGRVFLILENEAEGAAGGCMLQEVNSAKRELGKTYTGLPAANGNLLWAAGEENEFLISAGDSLYLYNLDEQSCRELTNWIDCDVNSNQLTCIDLLEDGRILALTYDYDKEDNAAEAVWLTERPASEAVEKTILTYATLYLDYDMRGQIIQFNKTSDKYRISVREYGTDPEDAMARLNSEIASGNTPDLIDLSNLDAENLIAKGVLTDLYPLLEGDGSLKREDFVPNALKLFERDGKLYGVAPSFGVVTVLGRTDDVGQRDGWTVADVEKLLASKPEGTELMEYADRTSVLEMLVRLGADSYIDWESGSCSFDSDEFRQILEFAAGFPAAEDISYDGEETYTKLSQGKLLLNAVNISSVFDFQYNKAMFGGADVSCIGYPTPDGSNGSYMTWTLALGVAEGSVHKEGAWSFVASLLDKEFQDRLSTWNLPIRRDSLTALFEKAMDKDKANQVGIAMGSFSYESRPATQEEIDALSLLIDTARSSAGINTEINNIIAEEAEAYFSGQKTAGETTKIIQSRVQLYVSENS